MHRGTSVQYWQMNTTNEMNLPGNSSAEAPKRTQRPVSKFAALQEIFLLQRSMQSVNINVPEKKTFCWMSLLWPRIINANPCNLEGFQWCFFVFFFFRGTFHNIFKLDTHCTYDCIGTSGKSFQNPHERVLSTKPLQRVYIYSLVLLGCDLNSK